ncbi:putative ribonuclease H-like domain-containing protein [Tanacetum coccineum]
MATLQTPPAVLTQMYNLVLQKCVKTYETLQKQFNEQRQTLSKANLEIIAYQLGLESVEAQLVVHQKSKVVYEEKMHLKIKLKDKISVVKGSGVTAVKASAGFERTKEYLTVEFPEAPDREIKNFLTDYQDIDGGFVAFGGSARGDSHYCLKLSDFYLLHLLPIPSTTILLSYISFLVSSISQPLQMLHMDLFGPTSVRSINHKTYCLVVTDDFSRFSWVFFLASKDETSGILKRFITEIENQLNHKVKVIRCDNGTEFKNREMNEFCGLKGIKREFSVARTPQQNGVAERKNMTLIEAARTMLADSLLPTVFWAEAVNTACYVLNRVLVTKPHNKTPYELIIGRPPNISFMRPFECPVTILNSLDPFCKFDGKAEEGFLVGYSVNNKAFRVFNSQTRKVEENLHVNFLENKPNVAGQGPNWLFNIDSLTNSINYQSVTAGNQTNKNASPQEANGDTGLKKSVDARKSEGKNVSTQQYIVFPLWSSISLSYKSSDETYKMIQLMMLLKEATEQSDAIRKEFEAQCNRELLQGKATKASSTNSFNTVSTPVNTASAPRTYNDVGPSYVSLGGSFPLDVNNFPNDPLMPDLEDTAEVQNTGIFGSAFDDESWIEAIQEELL